MAFLYPGMLYGLFALAIPLIVHLFHFRRHKLVYFSNTALLRDLQQQQSNTNKLKHLLVLLMRLLFVAALVIAFAQPYRTKEDQKTSANRLVVLYIDNSVSMQMPSDGGALIDEARKAAARLVAALPYSTNFVLLSNHFDLRHERPMNRDEFLQQINLLSANGPSVQLDEVLNRAASLRNLQQFGQRELILMSDFQSSGVTMEDVQADSLYQLFLMPFRAKLQANVFVDSCWLDSPVVQIGTPGSIRCRLRNESAEEMRGLAVSLTLNGQAEAVANADIPAKDFADVEMQFELNLEQYYQCVVSLIDFPIVFDDEYYFGLDVRNKISVLEVYGDTPSSELAILLGNDPLFDFQSQPQLRLDLQSLPDYQLLIVHNSSTMADGLQFALINSVKNGGSLLFLPSEEPNTSPESLLSTMGLSLRQTVDTARTLVQSLASGHDFFQDVFVRFPEAADLPKVKKHFQIHRNGDQPVTELIGLRNGYPFLVESRYGKGHFYLLASPLQAAWTTLGTDPLFVPLMYRMAFIANKLSPLSYTLGKDRQLIWNGLPKSDERPLRIASMDQSYSQMPFLQSQDRKTILTLYDQLPDAGFYGVYEGDSLLLPMAWNESRKESVLRFEEAAELEKRLSEKGFNVAGTLEAGMMDETGDWSLIAGATHYWKLFALLALLALLGESLLLRFWREPTIQRS